jgi:hypothetical protein
MKVGLWVPELLCETEINDVDLIATLSNTHKEIVRLDVPMNEVPRVNVLNT